METVTHRRAVISIGTVTTGAAGTDASATMTDGQVLNLVIPRGANGEAGPAGPRGPQGPSGEAADNFKPMPAETDNNIMSDLCDEVLDNGTPYVHPTTDSNNYYLNDGDCARTLLQRIKAFFVPQSRMVNGKALSSDVTLAYTDVNAARITARTVTLAPGSWSSKAQTVTCSGVTENNQIIVTPNPASYLNYHKWKVRCTAQAANKLTFTTDGTPSANLIVQVLILDGTK